MYISLNEIVEHTSAGDTVYVMMPMYQFKS